MHIGHLAASGDPRDGADGELGTVARAARVFAGFTGMDGTAWYHPMRLSIDARAINDGVDNPAQAVFGDHAIHGNRATMPIYAFQTSLGYANGQTRVIAAARQFGQAVTRPAPRGRARLQAADLRTYRPDRGDALEERVLQAPDPVPGGDRFRAMSWLTRLIDRIDARLDRRAIAGAG